MFRRPRRPGTMLAVVAAFVIALPLGAFASHQFSDVPDSNPFHADIDALADSGVTSGCGTGIYCPKDYVTREQMAAFMNRLGALAPSKTPVVNADKLDGLDSSQLAQHGTITHTYGSSSWTRSGFGGVGSLYAGSLWFRIQNAANTPLFAQITPLVPTDVLGAEYVLLSATYCATGSGTNYISSALLEGVNAAENPSVVYSVTDDANRTSYGCHTLNVTTPQQADTVTLTLTADLDNGGVNITRTAFTWGVLPPG